METRFPCGPSTMVITNLSEANLGNIYACGKQEERYEKLKSGAKMTMVNVITVFLAFAAVVTIS